jgi:thiosulfate/3-mercaptopyruvate sulfurtransferase
MSIAELNLLLHRNKKNLLLVDTRSFMDYAKGHVPGAVNIDLMQFHWIDTSKAGVRQFNKQMMILLSNIGVAKNKFVVFYDDISGPQAARGVWLLLYFSHKKVVMLDGGFERWKNEGYEIETKSNPFAHSNFKGRPNLRILATFKQIRAGIKKNLIMIDTRSKAEYEGSTARAARIGHIPTAINLDWSINIEKGIFKKPKQLERIYSTISKDAEVVTYCQGGYRAANSFIALKILGYKNVKMYLGSWGEWGNRFDLPVEKK